jgi:hypothetical protein
MSAGWSGFHGSEYLQLWLQAAEVNGEADDGAGTGLGHKRRKRAWEEDSDKEDGPDEEEAKRLAEEKDARDDAKTRKIAEDKLSKEELKVRKFTLHAPLTLEKEDHSNQDIRSKHCKVSMIQLGSRSLRLNLC